MHKNDVVYEDLTPKYISVDRNGYLILSDFTAEKYIKIIQHMKKLVITPNYAAPELFDKSLRFPGMTSMEGDWYSLGVIM